MKGFLIAAIGAVTLFGLTEPGPGVHDVNAADESSVVHGVTISCQTWGWEWGEPGFADELRDLASLGTNWVAIHPYASIGADGAVRQHRGRLDPEAPPLWLSSPIAKAREAGVSILIKPHLAYWGSPFAWRGEIQFDETEARARFWTDYTQWIVELARVTDSADAF